MNENILRTYICKRALVYYSVSDRLQFNLTRNVYTLFTQCLHNVYTMFTHCLHNVYTMFTQCLHTVYTLFTKCLHNVYTIFTHCLHTVYTLFTQCLHNVYTLFTHYLHTACCGVAIVLLLVLTSLDTRVKERRHHCWQFEYRRHGFTGELWPVSPRLWDGLNRV